MVHHPPLKWLRLMVFDLDCTLWPFHLDAFTFLPPFRREGAHVVDSMGKKMEPYPESLDVLKHWSKKCQIALASRTTYPQGAESLINLFGFDKFVTYKEIYPGPKDTHFTNLKIKSVLETHNMLFFDDEQRNIDLAKKLGVDTVLVKPEEGVTMKLVDEIVAKRFDGSSVN